MNLLIFCHKESVKKTLINYKELKMSYFNMYLTYIFKMVFFNKFLIKQFINALLA
jgi:hypothetical protein